MSLLARKARERGAARRGAKIFLSRRRRSGRELGGAAELPVREEDRDSGDSGERGGRELDTVRRRRDRVSNSRRGGADVALRRRRDVGIEEGARAQAAEEEGGAACCVAACACTRGRSTVDGAPSNAWDKHSARVTT
eukprot:6196791-Pleurochrysis_carterae.AAC.2